MSEYPWDDLLDEEDRTVIRQGGYGKSRGLGRRPALLVIDCQYNFIGADAPITEQQAQYPGGGGAGAWAAVRKIQGLTAGARANDVPVIYSRNVAKSGTRFDQFNKKIARDRSEHVEGHVGTEIVAELAPQADDILIDKGTASIFWGTPLDTYLVSMGIDSLILTGVSTSGCVRSSLVDGMARGYSTAIVADATADRIKASYKATLLDVWMKYGDVMDAGGVLEYLEGVDARAVAGR